MAKLLTDSLGEIRHPAGPAVRTPGGAVLSRQQLQDRADEIAGQLRSVGVEPGEPVVLVGEPDERTIAGLWGILLAGCAYVPLDAHTPAARLELIMDKARARVAVGAEDQLAHLSNAIGADSRLKSGVAIDGAEPTISSLARSGASGPAPSRTPSRPDLLSYVLYTSGSTGTPKGVTHTHGSSRAFVDWAVETAALNHNDRVAGFAPLHFDLSVFDVFGSISAGATLVPLPTLVKRFPALLAAALAEHRISVLYAVPTSLGAMLRAGALSRERQPDLRLVISAGEELPATIARQLMEALPGCRLLNWYGPTETNVCTSFEVTAENLGNLPMVPIGYPVAGDEALVLDSDLHECREGELFVRGATLMAGYLEEPALTGTSLLPVHSAGLSGTDHMYRTGDRVRLLPDGSLYFLGRLDNQTKRHGYRIELGEIDCALRTVEGVAECVSLIRKDDTGRTHIESFVMASGQLDSARVLQGARRRLPSHMLPDEVHVVPDLPTTASGKVDRDSLARRAPRVG